MFITERLEEDGEEPPVWLGISPFSHLTCHSWVPSPISLRPHGFSSLVFQLIIESMTWIGNLPELLKVLLEA